MTAFITGGASNELFEIRRGGHRVALRRPPRVVPAGRNETMLREYRLLAALADTDVPHARVVAVCDDPELMGGCFYLMEFVDGWSPLGGGGWPAPFDTDLDARRGLAFQLVDGIAKLAKVDWQSRGLEGFGRPDGFHERQVDRWMSHLDAVQVPRHPRHRHRRRLAAGPQASQLRAGDHARRLPVRQRHVPPRRAGPPGRDRRLGDGDGRRPAPRPRLGDPGVARPRREQIGTGSYVDYTGMPTRAELLDYYEAESGRSTDDIDYYVILARFKLAVVLEAGYARVVQGEADNPKMEPFGDVVLDLAAEPATSRRAPDRGDGACAEVRRTPGRSVAST